MEYNFDPKIDPKIRNNIKILLSLCYFLFSYVLKVHKMVLILFKLCFCALDNENS